MAVLTNAYFYYHMELFHLKTFNMKNPKQSFLKRLKRHSDLLHKKEYLKPICFYKKCYQSLIVNIYGKEINTSIKEFLESIMIDLAEIITKLNDSK